MGNERHSGSESMPSLGDAAPQTWGAGQSVPQHGKVGTQPPPQQLKRKPGEIGEADPRENKKRIDKAYRERMKQEKLKIKDKIDKLAAECEQLKANLKGITDEKQKLELLAENQRLRLEKQHSEEIRSLEKQHSDEIRRLEKEHSDEIRSLQKQLSDTTVKKERSDCEIKSLKRELDEEKKKVQDLSAFNNWKTELSTEQPEWPVQSGMDHLREDQPVYAHAAKDLASVAHLHVGNVGAASYSGTGTDDFSELSPFLDLPLLDVPPYW